MIALATGLRRSEASVLEALRLAGGALTPAALERAVELDPKTVRAARASLAARGLVLVEGDRPRHVLVRLAENEGGNPGGKIPGIEADFPGSLPRRAASPISSPRLEKGVSRCSCGSSERAREHGNTGTAELVARLLALAVEALTAIVASATAPTVARPDSERTARPVPVEPVARERHGCASAVYRDVKPDITPDVEAAVEERRLEVERSAAAGKGSLPSSPGGWAHALRRRLAEAPGEVAEILARRKRRLALERQVEERKAERAAAGTSREAQARAARDEVAELARTARERATRLAGASHEQRLEAERRAEAAGRRRGSVSWGPSVANELEALLVG